MQVLLAITLLVVGANAGTVAKPEVKQLRCSWQDWLECAAKVAECAATCDGTPCDGVSFYDCPACLTCFGSSADQCIKCLYKSAIGPITPAVKSTALKMAPQPKCAWQDWLECAAKVAECAATCDGTPCDGVSFYDCPACLQCFGPLAQQCIKCLAAFKLSLMREEAKAIGVQTKVTAVQLRSEPKCSWQDWLECAAKVAECAATCDGTPCDGVSFYDCPACLACFGTSADQCIKCLKKTKTAITQQTTAVALKTQPKCAWQDWLECAAKVAECAATCDGTPCDGVSFYDCPACLKCFGPLAQQCIKCLAKTKYSIMITQ